MQPFVVDEFRHALPPRLARTPAAAQQVAVGDDVGPVVLTRVVHADQHLRPAPQHREHFQRLLRQARNTEHHHPARQVGGTFILRPVRGATQEGCVHACPPGIRCRRVRTRAAGPAGPCLHVGQQGAPERCLPAMSVRQWLFASAGVDQDILARLPGCQPVGAIHLILIEEVGEALGKLEALAPIAVPVEETEQRRVLRIVHHFRQQAHQTPEQPRFVERRTLRHRRSSEQCAIHPPQKARRQRNFECRSDPAAPCCLTLPRIGSERQLEPLRNAIALHQDDLVLERRQRIAFHPFDDQLAQHLRLIAMHEHQARRQGWEGQVGLRGSVG
ncbi:MAG: hypothetical protein AW09_000285 [Candidatus Accumulibacter phosphatis]|uniref:Uncharacterized protein n=1 Tax=Candidatus Accumulibacter phosphatis TaxID=327160 RepID=A0A080LZW7_9PROT|nr:MAG: hypothetical protein AW09_000285 [Candidatus Accumulibacter phosphatis]